MTRFLYAKIETGYRLVAADITDLTFFPKGTILTFSAEAWNATSAEFKNIWKICDGHNGAPNLIDKFLRGADADSSGAEGGGTATITTGHLPNHTHTATVTDPGHQHSFQYGDDNNNGPGYNIDMMNKNEGNRYVNSSTTGISVSVTGGGSSNPAPLNIVPAFYTVIYIIKIA